MADLVLIERDALADLVVAVNMLTKIIQTSTQQVLLPDEEIDKLKYVNKLVETAMKSFDNYNKPPQND
jgi:hypothetical protein